MQVVMLQAAGITVAAARVYGSRAKTFANGTNAHGFGLGVAMLVGVDLPASARLLSAHDGHDPARRA